MSQNDRAGELCGLVRALCAFLGVPVATLPPPSGANIAPLDTRRYFGEVHEADRRQREDADAEMARFLNR